METAFEDFEKDSLLIEQQDEFLRRNFFHPFLSYQPVSKGVEELRCREEVRVDSWTRFLRR
jgi:hypothetical protein